MLDTEITKTGEVVVEGHTIGRLDGFRFAPDATSTGSDAKALSAAAQKLAGEIEARANRLSHAPDAQFVLTSDATIRWIGEPVAKLVAGDVVLRPRVRILADDHLTGAALEAVQTRLDLWTRTHIERLLAPLFVLGAADDITGLARGVAYQIVEALGVLERSKVADDLKSSTRPRAPRCASTACGLAPTTSMCRCCSSRRHERSRRSCGPSSTAVPRRRAR